VRKSFGARMLQPLATFGTLLSPSRIKKQILVPWTNMRPSVFGFCRCTLIILFYDLVLFALQRRAMGSKLSSMAMPIF
jgi:hypothetical protein